MAKGVRLKTYVIMYARIHHSETLKKGIFADIFFENCFNFSFIIDNITLDPDPNWTKIQDLDPKFNVFGSRTLTLGQQCEVASFPRRKHCS